VLARPRQIGVDVMRQRPRSGDRVGGTSRHQGATRLDGDPFELQRRPRKRLGEASRTLVGRAEKGSNPQLYDDDLFGAADPLSGDLSALSVAREDVPRTARWSSSSRRCRPAPIVVYGVRRRRPAGSGDPVSELAASVAKLWTETLCSLPAMAAGTVAASCSSLTTPLGTPPISRRLAATAIPQRPPNRS